MQMRHVRRSFPCCFPLPLRIRFLMCYAGSTQVSDELWPDVNASHTLLLKIVLECARDGATESLFQQKLEDSDCSDTAVLEAVELYKKYKEDIRTQGMFASSMCIAPN